MESTPGATLDPPMCKGKRSFAREWDSEITVKIDGTEDHVELWAGWARGFEPVKLTKRIVLWKKGMMNSNFEDEDEDDEDYHEAIYEEHEFDDDEEHDDDEADDEEEEDDEEEYDDDDDDEEADGGDEGNSEL